MSTRIYPRQWGGGGDRGVTISRFPYPVLPPPVRFCPFVSRLPPFIVFLPLSRKSRCLTPYSDSNRECFGLVQNKKLCCKSNHSALSSAIIEAAFLRHKFTPLGKIFITVSLQVEVSHDEAKMRERRERPLPASEALFDEAADQISAGNLPVSKPFSFNV